MTTSALQPGALYTPYLREKSTTLKRGPSWRLWSRVLGPGASPDGAVDGYLFEDEMLNVGDFNTGGGGATTGTIGGYGVYVDTAVAAGSIRHLATVYSGALRILSSTQDNAQASIAGASGVGVQAVFPTALDKKLAFEARVAFGTIANNNFFLGLTEETCCANDGLIDDTGALADVDHFGFCVLEGASSTLTFKYRKNGQAQQTPIANVLGVAIVANTYYKLGFVFDPAAIPAQRVTFYLNGEELSTYLTAANLAAATFPAGEEMALAAQVKNGAAAAKSMDIDWWRLYQEV